MAAPAPRPPMPESAPPPPPMSAPPAPVVAPPVIIDSPEFQKALQAAVAQAMAAQAPQAAGNGAISDITQLGRSIALAIAEMNDVNAPQSAPVRVSPEVAEQRRVATEKMHKILLEYQPGGKRSNQEPPRYRCTSKVYLDEEIVNPYRMDVATKLAVPVFFSYLGEPSDAMEPENEAAREVFALFKQSRFGDKGLPKKQSWMTAGGLVVEGRPQRRREIMTDTGQSLGLHIDSNPHDPNARAIRILGTVASPAMRNGNTGVAAHEQGRG